MSTIPFIIYFVFRADGQNRSFLKVYARDPHYSQGVQTHFFAHDILYILSGYKINSSKTEALHINITPAQLSRLQSHYHWCQHSIKYLGTNTTYWALFKVNYALLFQESQKLLKQWNSYNLSLLGRITMLKMSILLMLRIFLRFSQSQSCYCNCVISKELLLNWMAFQGP